MSRRLSILVWAVLAMFAAGCQTTVVDTDPYSAGERALAAGQLVDALRNFDGVPIDDLRYPEARLTAAAIERRLRRHKELVLLGLRLRSEWRDDEALVVLQSALREWPEHRETKDLIQATRGRLAVLADLREQLGTPGQGPSSRADVEPRGSGAAQLPATPSPQPQRTGTQPIGATPPGGAAQPRPDDRPRAVARPVTPRSRPRPGQPIQDEVAVELARLALASSTGELLISDLEALQRSWPDDPRVTRRLARLFQQRGLMHYGNGDVAAAITDWQRALDLDPDLRAARVLFDLATTELARPRGR